ncbi:uncharacterized protein LOC119164247 [Rhipicephalus microplus]|uniref:uncharacterized protein LOC119164247 n=1 Tax=Rhipicephalus microplus TaxID=6941 RepID=UPI003F6B7E8C
MQCIAVVLATIVIVPVSGDSSCSKTGNCKELACGPLEVPVSGKPRYDHFCRPLFTPPWELRKLRRCVCKRRYLRNSWGECIPRLKCIPCQFRWQKDYRECVDGCPATCNFPFRKSCDKPCAPGCGCPPGWVVHPRKPWKCIKTNGCLPKCPAHSEFQSCVSSCLPKCGRVTPEKCEVNCNRGACVCKKGYIGLEEEGKLTCVREVVCSWITRSKPSLKPSDIPHSGTPGGTLTPTSTLSKIVGQALNATMTAATISSSGSQANPVETPSISDASHPAGVVSAGTQGGSAVSGVSGTTIGVSASTQGGDTLNGVSGVTEASSVGIRGGGTASGVSAMPGESIGRTQS